MQITVEVDSVTAVSDYSLTVSRLFVKAVAHCIRSIIQTKQPAMHQLGCRRFQYSGVAHLSVLQMRNHELSHIGCRTTKTSRRKWIYHFERLCLIRTEPVTAGHQRRKL